MNTIKFLLLSCILCLGTAVYAQKTVIFKFNHPARQGKHAGNLSSIDIISALPDSVNIGVIPSAVPNTRDNLVTPEGVTELLRGYVNSQYGASFIKNGTGLLWSIREFSVGIDSSAEDMISYIKIGADIARQNGASDNYQSIGSFDTLLITRGNDMLLDSQTAIAVNALYDYSERLVSAGKSGNEIFKKEDLKKKYKKNQEWKILADTVYPKGIYLSFQEFKNNTPSVSEFVIKVDTATKQVNLYRFSVGDSSVALIADAWGLSINNELYRYKNGQLYAIEKRENEFALSKYLDFRTRKNQGFFWRRSIGSRQGNNNPFDDNHIYRTPAKSGSSLKVETTKLDSTSGELTF